MQKHTRGFTLVELMVAIVIIAILASITTMSYNGVQQKARNAARIAAVKAWVEGIEIYIAKNHAYPGNSTSLYCIGESNITDFDANPDVDCGVSNNIKHSNTYTTTFNANVKTVIDTLPAFPGTPVKLTSTTSGSGLLLRAYDVYDPAGENVPNYPTLIYFLEGKNQDCVLRPLAAAYTGGQFTKGTGINSGSDIGTGCRLMLPDPRNL